MDTDSGQNAIRDTREARNERMLLETKTARGRGNRDGKNCKAMEGFENIKKNLDTVNEDS